jgi:hypothetical protein
VISQEELRSTGLNSISKLLVSIISDLSVSSRFVERVMLLSDEQLLMIGLGLGLGLGKGISSKLSLIVGEPLLGVDLGLELGFELGL